MSPAPGDSLDTGPTVPLKRSPQGQAWVPSTPTPVGKGTLPLGTPAVVVPSRPVAQIGTLPLDTPAVVVPPRPVAQAGTLPLAAPPTQQPGGWPTDRSADATLATSSDAGTITRASTEAAPRPSTAGKRNNVIVLGALFAAVLVIAVVGWTVISVVTSPELAADAPAIQLPSAAAGTVASLDTPTAVATNNAPAASGTAAPTAVQPASTSASASASAKARAPTGTAGPRSGGPPSKASPTVKPADLNNPLF